MSFRSLGVAVTLLASYAVGLRCLIASDATMAILSSGGHFPAWAILATLAVLLLRVVVIVVLPAVLFAKLGGAAFDAWPRMAQFFFTSGFFAAAVFAAAIFAGAVGAGTGAGVAKMTTGGTGTSETVGARLVGAATRISVAALSCANGADASSWFSWDRSFPSSLRPGRARNAPKQIPMARSPAAQATLGRPCTMRRVFPVISPSAARIFCVAAGMATGGTDDSE